MGCGFKSLLRHQKKVKPCRRCRVFDFIQRCIEKGGWGQIGDTPDFCGKGAQRWSFSSICCWPISNRDVIRIRAVIVNAAATDDYRSRGISMEQRLKDLNTYLRGWVGYFRLADTISRYLGTCTVCFACRPDCRSCRYRVRLRVVLGTIQPIQAFLPSPVFSLASPLSDIIIIRIIRIVNR